MDRSRAQNMSMTDRLPRIPLDQLDEEQRAVYARITGGVRAQDVALSPLVADDGTLNGPFAVMVYSPVLGSILEQLGAAIRYRADLSPRLREIAILQVAHAVGSEFEWWAHARIAKAVGLSTAELDALARDSYPGIDEAEQALVELCRILLGEQSLTDSEFARFRAELGISTILEVTILVGYYRMLAQLMTVFDIGIPLAKPAHNG